MTLNALLARHFPAADAAGVISVAGLSGGGLRVTLADCQLAARQAPDPAMPGVSLRRQYRAMKRLRETGIGPRPRLLADGWLISEWIEGTSLAAYPPLPELTGLLYDLHRQPLYGWRISIGDLLERYWLGAHPSRRSIGWLRWLKQLRRRGEPAPLRLAPLHMDVHPGNLIRQGKRLRLIDWEYAGDGDVALELATILSGMSVDEGQWLIAHYAGLARLEPQQLARQAERWRPWVNALMAGWYECRWRQTEQQQFIQLADNAWRCLQTEEQKW
ncbi:thiamine kinase [Erwinia sp. CPCC 100877]|nr:thiamine kinase [Erwinia sp. CPCC 100877]